MHAYAYRYDGMMHSQGSRHTRSNLESEYVYYMKPVGKRTIMRENVISWVFNRCIKSLFCRHTISFWRPQTSPTIPGNIREISRNPPSHLPTSTPFFSKLQFSSLLSFFPPGIIHTCYRAVRACSMAARIVTDQCGSRVDFKWVLTRSIRMHTYLFVVCIAQVALTLIIVTKLSQSPAPEFHVSLLYRDSEIRLRSENTRLHSHSWPCLYHLYLLPPFHPSAIHIDSSSHE